MSRFVEFKKITYFYAFLTALAFALAIFVSANVVDVSSSFVPFLCLSIFDILNVFLVKKYAPRDCFGSFFISSISVYIFYKIVSLVSFFRMCSSDGFLTDGEFAHAYALDILMISLVISTFVFNVFMRFLVSKQKIKHISRESIKRFLICMAVFVVIGTISVFSWSYAKPMKDDFIKHVSTFSTEKWKTFPESRIRMFDNLTVNYKLDNMKKDDIVKLLGEPDVTENETMIYKLGDNEKGHNRIYIYTENDSSVGYEVKTEEFI